MSKTVVHEIAAPQTHGFESVSGDRPYTSELFTKLHNSMTLGGYASNEAGHLDVFATGTDKIVTVQKGTAFIAGHFLQLKNTHDVSLADAPANQIRWDIIAIRINRATAERKISIIKIEGNSTATDDTTSIPWDQLQTDDLLLGSGIFEFPIAVIKTSGTANITQDRITKTLSSVNALEPFPIVLDESLGLSTQIGGRILVPNEPATNTPHEITIRIKVPKNTSTNKLAIVINDFLGADTMIPIVDQADTELQADTLSEQSIFITISADKTKAVTQTPLEIYNVQPLTTQLSITMEQIEITDPALSSTHYYGISTYNNRIYFSNTGANSAPSKLADIDSDGNFSNFRDAFTNQFSARKIRAITFLPNNKALVMAIGEEDENIDIYPGIYEFNLLADGKLEYVKKLTNPDSSADIKTWKSIEYHENKLYITNENSRETIRFDIDENLNLTNPEKIFRTPFASKLDPVDKWTGIKFINDKAYIFNENPDVSIVTSKDKVPVPNILKAYSGLFSAKKYIHAGKLISIAFDPITNKTFYWNDTDKFITYTKTINPEQTSPQITEMEADARYKPIGDPN